jgi:sacsin
VIIGSKFGQHEPLTTRLHNLVRSYPKGLGILKEFIQNADDAEADEIVFVIDEQEYEVTGLPDSMHWLHTTPALLVYNNKSFSDRDIKGIQDIGDSGKSLSLGKTGRFGLGFNSSYNVTDVPCFFTRNELYFFDPHFQTIPEASVESPGRSFRVDELIGAKWPLLDAFLPFAGNGYEFDGTVFRLPFRSTQQASNSRIKKDAYTVSDALEAVNELQQMGSAILLFLKNVRRLKVEHRKRDGSVLCLLSIHATNFNEIVKSRAEVNTLLSSPDPDCILGELSERGSVYSSCRHEYLITENEIQRTETWRVIDGFFVDDKHEVINACRKILDKEEKALPYAGTAWSLDSDRQSAGRLFCFLPIPMQTSMPVQINGYFDLDESRQNMFLDRSAHGSDRLRVDWNRILLQTSVAMAYVQLLEELRLDIGIIGIDSYCRAFPTASTNEGGWEYWLTATFYPQAAIAPLIWISGGTQWRALSETRSLPHALLSMADLLVAEDFLPIPFPSLPHHLRHGFTICDIDVPELTPHELRIQLKEQRDVDCPLHIAPRACLRKRDYIEQIFRFCLSDYPENDISGLPLAIDSRGHLRTLGFTVSPLYLAGKSWDLEVFWDRQNWFVDFDFANNVGLSEAKGAKLFDMDSERFVSELAAYVSAQNANEDLRMKEGAFGSLTDTWLRAVFKRLIESDLSKLKSEVNKIPLIPDQNRVLHSMGSAATPLLSRGSKELRRALNELSVPLVQGVSDELFQLLLDFSRKEDCLWTVTPRDLIDTLECQCEEILQSYEKVTDAQRALLDYFSKEESLADIQKFTDRQKTLRGLKIFPTAEGRLVNLEDSAYVPQEFKFPTVNFDVVLLDDGHKHQWRGLFDLLNVPELSRARLIREVLLPCFADLEPTARIEASSWLRDNLSFAQSEDESKTPDNLFEEVRNAPIIVCEDGTLRPPKSVYQPESKLANDILGDQAAFPDMLETYAQNHDRWLEFFRQLDMPIEPRIADVVTYVRKLVSNAPGKENSGRLQTVYNFVRGRVDSEIQYQNELSYELSEAIDELAEIAWIPLRNEAGDLLCFSAPKEAYGCPRDIYFPRVGQLVASQAYITVLRPEPSKIVREAMGFPIKPPVELVVHHFEQVLALCSTEEAMPNEGILVRALAQIYRFFGGEAPKEPDAPEDTIEERDNDGAEDLETKFSEIPCIWDQKEKRFWRPSHVFSDNVQYMDPWRRTVRNNDDAIERGYEALGRKQSPTIGDWKQVLKEMSENRCADSQGEVTVVIREVVRRIVEDLNQQGIVDDEVLVPTRRGGLVPAKAVYLADAPWYESMLDSLDVPLLSSSVSGIWGIQRVLGIPSLAASIEQRLIEYPAVSDLMQERTQCSNLESLLRSNELIFGLRRLLRHEGHEVSSHSLSYLQQINVKCVKSIRTCLYLQTDGSERLIGDAEAEFYLDEENMVAMLAEHRRKYFHDDLADLLNRTLKDNSLMNLAPLVRILGYSPDEISETLDALKIRKYTFDVDEECMDQDEIAPQEFPDYDVEEMERGNDVATEECIAPVQIVDSDIAEVEIVDEQAKPSLNDSESGKRMDRPSEPSTATRPQSSFSGQSTASPGNAHFSGQYVNDGSPGSESHIPGSSQRQYVDMEKQGSGDGTSRTQRESISGSHRPSTQRRLVSYVSHTNNDSESGSTGTVDNDRQLQIGELAVRIVIEHEKRIGREARPMAHLNAGYDVIAEGLDEKRYIEVKGTEAAWGERGVSMTATQFFYARKNPGRDHWLYVVEGVLSSTPRIYKIHNPSELVDRFIFDGGWKQIAESDDAEKIEILPPAQGDEVLFNGVFVGIVESTLPFGKFPLVIYRDLEGNQQKKRLADITVRAKQT